MKLKNKIYIFIGIIMLIGAINAQGQGTQRVGGGNNGIDSTFIKGDSVFIASGGQEYFSGINAVSRPSGEIVYGTGTGITSDTKIKADGTGIRLTSINAESWPLRFINTNGPDGISIDYDNGSNTATNQDIGKIQFRPRFNNSLSNEVASISATYTGTGTTRKGSLTLRSSESDGNFITGLSIEGLIAYLQPNGGKVGIGTTTPARTLHVTGEARITDLTTDTPTRIVGADADGDLGAITRGTGLQFSNDTLNARGAYYKWVEVSSATYTITDEDMILVNCTSNNITLTLPTGAADGKQIIVKRIDTTGGRQVDWVGTLEGSVDPTNTLTTATFPAYTIVKTGSSWLIISEKP